MKIDAVVHREHGQRDAVGHHKAAPVQLGCRGRRVGVRIRCTVDLNRDVPRVEHQNVFKAQQAGRQTAHLETQVTHIVGQHRRGALGVLDRGKRQRVTVPRNPMSPLPTASSLNVAGTFTSLLPVLSSVPPTPTHRSTPSSVTLIACASVSVVVPSVPKPGPASGQSRTLQPRHHLIGSAPRCRRHEDRRCRPS